jgi:hypothetical protein
MANLYVTGQEKIDRDVSSTGAYRDTACFARMSPAVVEMGRNSEFRANSNSQRLVRSTKFA